ncbi:MAG: signal transduction histidine kinase [Marivirga sp.]|jgi:signal transduction histidine kinase
MGFLKKLKVFNFSSWSTLNRSTVQKSDIFLSQFAILATVGAGISSVHDAFFESLETVIIDLIIVSIFLLVYIINERGRHLRAKVLFVFLSPTSMFIYASLLPKESGVYLIFFPIIMIIFLVFDKRDKPYQIIALVYTVLLLFILELTAYQPFGINPVFETVSSGTSYIINLFIALFIIIFSLFSMENVNNEIENKRQEALVNLNKKNEELKEINNELDQFVYSASHDLKAPLLSVLGLINIAKYDVKEAVALDYFQQIEKRIFRLNAFIKEVLSISKNARTDILRDHLDIKALINEVIEQNNYIEGVNEVKIKVDMKFTHKVYIDKYRLEIILNNLISNALKYQKKGSANQQLEVRGMLNKKVLCLKIKDNGVGIAAEDRKKVFEMFYRANEKSEGSGLGLYIVQSALKKLSGTIELKSEVGQGTEVTLSIPTM